MTAGIADDALPRPWTPDAWRRRVESDKGRACDLLTGSLCRATTAVIERAQELGAQSVAVTGSTARGHRTLISDLDFHVVGPRPYTHDLREEIDVYATSAREMARRLRAGDGYIQWTLRYGLILHDEGPFRDAARWIVAHDHWPDPERKRERARGLVDLASRILRSEDRDAGEEAVSAALTATVHWVLLANRVFPLSRDELPAQVGDLGGFDLAAALHRSIHGEPGLDELAAGVRLARHALSLTARGAPHVRVPPLAAQEPSAGGLGGQAGERPR